MRPRFDEEGSEQMRFGFINVVRIDTSLGRVLRRRPAVSTLAGVNSNAGWVTPDASEIMLLRPQGSCCGIGGDTG